jgi:hypothetical protein
MAYVSQELKAKLAPTIKSVCKKYGIKASLAVRNHMSLVLTVKQGKVDFINNYLDTVGRNEHNEKWVGEKRNIDVNVYHYRNHFTGKARQFLEEVITAMNNGNHDRSDIQTDYFDVGWYVDVNIGKWNQPYALVK